MTAKKKPDIDQQLVTPIPEQCIATRKGAGDRDLSYVSGRYTKQRLNEIFGWDGWSSEIKAIQLFPADCTAFVHLRLSVRMPDSEEGITRDGVAYGHGRKGAEGFDFAIAEAATDALKRAAVTLGQNLGLELYPMTPLEPKADTAEKDVIAEIPQVKDFANAIGECSDLEVLAAVGAQIKEAALSASSRGGLGELFMAKQEDLNG
jgi:hypothetical protein